MNKNKLCFFLLVLFSSELGFSRILSEKERPKPYFNLSLRRAYVEQSTGEREPHIGAQLSFHHPLPWFRPLHLGLSFSYILSKGPQHPKVSIETDYLDLTIPFTFSYNYFFRYHVSLEPGLSLERVSSQILGKEERDSIFYGNLKSTFGIDYSFTKRIEVSFAGEALYRVWRSRFDFSYLIGMQFRL